MDQTQAQEDLLFIRNMIEKTRKSFGTFWRFLIFWGVLLILALVAMHVLVYFEKFDLIWIDWIAFTVVGVVGQLVMVIGDGRRIRVKTYAQQTVAHLCFSAGIAYGITGLLFPLCRVYHVGVISLVVAVITGILLFTLGGILEYRFLKIGGILWLVSSAGMVFIHWHYRSLIFIPLILITYLIPGFRMYKGYLREGSHG